jgi:MFS family permease
MEQMIEKMGPGNVAEGGSYVHVYTPFRRIVAASVIQAIIGVGVATIAILGLAHLASIVFVSIAAIAVGTAVMFQGGMISARYHVAVSEEERNEYGRKVRGWAQVGVMYLAGIAGITLGILSLLGFVPTVLVPAALVALGISLLFGSAVSARLNAKDMVRFSGEAEKQEMEMLRERGLFSAGVQSVAGVAAVGLGVLALAMVFPIELSLIAVLALGFGLFLNGAVLSRMMQAFGHRS